MGPVREQVSAGLGRSAECESPGIVARMRLRQWHERPAARALDCMTPAVSALSVSAAVLDERHQDAGSAYTR